jgi:uncharacterized Fe-S cluster-containing radical SAM superfamily enzyme
MVELQFEDLGFEKLKDGRIRAFFLERFYFDFSEKESKDVEIKDRHSIEFNGIERQFNQLISRKISDELICSYTGRRTIYVHQGPIVGVQRFGILDSDTNCIEIRPITGCNLNCIYCSVKEGSEKKNAVDYVLDKDLIVREFKSVAAGKKDVYVYISGQGEPLFYSKIVELVSDISEIEQVKNISINTNGSLLTKELIDSLKVAGLTRFNLSLNAIDPELASRIAGVDYDIEHVKEMARYIHSVGLDLVIAPVYLDGINDGEMDAVIKFAKEIGAFIGIQNFLQYSGGRRPTQELEFDDFKGKLRVLEEKHGIKLIDPDTGIKMIEQKTLNKPFRKGQVIVVEARYPGIGVARNRLVSVPRMDKKQFKVKLVRDKHNIFAGV